MLYGDECGADDDTEYVITPRMARRRAWWGLGIVLGAWVGFDVAIGLLVRTHHLDAGYVGDSLGVGVIACFVAFPTFHGSNFRARLVRRGGRGFVVANTLTGPRAIDLDALVSVRRFPIPSRSDEWDELRLRDRHGVRLAVARCESEVEIAVRSAAEASGASISRCAEKRLDPRRRDAGGERFLAFLTVLCCTLACMLGSAFLTSLISGTRFS